MATETFVRAPTATTTSRYPVQASSPGGERTAPAVNGAGPAFKTITPEQFAALPGGRSKHADVLAGAVVALARGACISLSVPAKKVPATRQALRKLAKASGFDLEIRSGPDYVAARKVEPDQARGARS